ncbi:sensor histidine kinase [Cohnella suwonensis]|uniref:histidine kinase n=1 Tax=Cohnella suwonensis TaxID=696072 RepID=A0ABW0LYL2_9BACL
MSHDLKTPLSSIIGYAHMMEAEAYTWTQEEVRSFAKVILDKSYYLEGLANDLTLTYRARSGGASPALSATEVNAFLASAVREAINHPAYDADRVRFRASDGPAYIAAYAPWLQRIVDNLVANALTHNREGTTLTISVKPSGSFVSIDFADDGDGMDEATASRLFERYYRGVDTDSRSEGTGLGMAVAKALAESMDGTIGVSASVGRGTTIRLAFPAIAGTEETIS